MTQEKYLWTVKVGDKGQIVIPKEARQVFDIKTGDNLILFGDINRGIAIGKYDEYVKFAEQVIESKNRKDD